MKHLNQKLLLQYYDKELSVEKRKKIGQLIANQHEKNNSLQQMETISELFSIMQEENLKNASFEGFDKRILNQIQISKTKLGFFEKVSIWFQEFFQYRKTIWIPTASLVGATALALVFLSAPLDQDKDSIPGTTTVETWKAGISNQTASNITPSSITNVEVKTYTVSTAQGHIGVAWIEEGEE